jgi:hypothetical protein
MPYSDPEKQKAYCRAYSALQRDELKKLREEAKKPKNVSCVQTHKETEK